MMDAGTLDQIAVEGYQYFYPLVTMDVTRLVATNLPPGVKPGFGPPNQFSHMREFPPGDFRDVVRPNFDTLYSSAWLDLSDGPLVISVTEPVDRYFMLPLLDMWTDVFALIGTRTTGGGLADYALVPPDWDGSLPDGMQRLEAPTRHVWIIGRTQTNGPSDYEAVHRIQNGFRITSLADFPEQAVLDHVPDSDADVATPPIDQVHSMTGVAYFTYASRLLALHRPHPVDQPMIARLRSLGIEPGEAFDPDAASPEALAAIEQAPKAALAQMTAVIPNMNPVINGWSMATSDIGVYGVNYLFRAVITMVGLGANRAEDAIYPLLLVDSDGEPATGERDYLIHFDPDQIPPVDAFWSITMYDKEGFPVPNEIDRYAIGDRDDLQFGEDGSLDIYISSTNPGPEREANWLPAPPGQLGITLRLYNPKPEALDGRWSPPPLAKPFAR